MPAQPVSDALFDIALRSRISLGGEVNACRGTAPALRGVMTLETALSRTLEGSGCVYVVSRNGAVIIRRAPVERPAPPPVVAPRPAAPPPAPLQPISLDAPSELSDIIVTAERRPESPQSAAVSVTAVTGEQIVASGALDSHDLSTLVAGMTVTNLGSGRNKILLRGMSDGAFTGQTQSTVGLYLNQVPITYSAPDPDLRLIDIDRVEVLRGPQGVLYGTGPIGGVVKLVTRRPDPLDSSIEIGASRSATEGGGINTDYSAIANLPLPGGWGALRGVAYQESLDGYIDDVSLSLRRVNAASRRGGRLAYGVHLGESWELTAGLAHQSIDTEDTHYVYRILGGLKRANLVREPHDNDFTQTYLNLDGAGSWGRFNASVAWVDHRFRSRYDASSALRAFGSSGRIGALDDAKNIHLFVAETTWRSPQRDGVEWLIGGFFTTSQTVSDTTLVALWPVVQRAYQEDREDKLTELAVFGQMSWDLTPDLTLTAGARVYSFDYEARSLVTQWGGHRPFEGQKRTSGFSPRVSLDWRYNDRISLYALVSQGHRTGGFNTAGPLTQDFSGRVGSPSHEYAGDTLWNFEAGTKAVSADGRIQARVAAFLTDWHDLQSDQFLPSGLAYAVNVGDAANRGVEIEANWRVTNDLEIRGNALLADPRITRPSERFNSKGDAGLPGVPAVSANLNFDWRRPVGWGLTGFVEGSVAYVGPSRLTFDAERRYRMGDYVTGRVSTGFESDHWTVLAFVENPFNTAANTFAFGDPFRLPEALATTPLRPRTVGVALKVSM